MRILASHDVTDYHSTAHNFLLFKDPGDIAGRPRLIGRDRHYDPPLRTSTVCEVPRPGAGLERDRLSVLPGV